MKITQLSAIGLFALVGLVSAASGQGIVSTDVSTLLGSAATFNLSDSTSDSIFFELGALETPTVVVNPPTIPFDSNDSFELVLIPGSGVILAGAEANISVVTTNGFMTQDPDFLTPGQSVVTALESDGLSNYASFTPSMGIPGLSPSSSTLNPGTYYLGVADAADENPGWVEFTLTCSTLTLDAFAVNTTPGSDILVGQVSAVPESKTWAWLSGVLALGLAAGMAVKRREASWATT